VLVTQFLSLRLVGLKLSNFSCQTVDFSLQQRVISGKAINLSLNEDLSVAAWAPTPGTSQKLAGMPTSKLFEQKTQTLHERGTYVELRPA
jgi:hypothetical protein